MRTVRNVILTAMFAVIGFLLTTQAAAALEVDYGYPTSSEFDYMLEGRSVEFTITVRLDPQDDPARFGVFRVSASDGSVVEAPFSFEPEQTEIQVPLTFTFTPADRQSCLNANGSLAMSVELFDKNQGFVSSAAPSFGCGVGIEPNLEAFNNLTQIEVCGPNNNAITGMEHSEPGVIINLGEWSDNELWAWISEDPPYRFYGTVGAERPFEDDDTPCIAAPASAPQHVLVCGTANDTIVLAETQPENINPVPVDSGWINGVRTITYEPVPGYAFANPNDGHFAFTDDNLPCADIQRVTVVVIMPDTGSAEGAPWALYARTTSQAEPAPYEVGVVDANSTFLLPELVPGNYRLTVSVDGYVPLDTMLNITAETTRLEVEIAALQPFPTAEPTEAAASPAPLPTEVPAEPTAPPAQAGVTALPETGAGSGNGSLLGLASIGIVAAMVLALGNRRMNQ